MLLKSLLTRTAPQQRVLSVLPLEAPSTICMSSVQRTSTVAFHYKDSRPYSSTATVPFQHDAADSPSKNSRPKSATVPGSRAFVECELYALVDLFDKYALPLDTVASNRSKFVNQDGLQRLMNAVGESPSDRMLKKLFEAADADGNGVIDLDVSVAGRKRGGPCVFLCGCINRSMSEWNLILCHFFSVRNRNFCWHLIPY